MPCNTFKRIICTSLFSGHLNLHLCDNEKLDKEDKFLKFLPVINDSNRRFLKFSFNR